MWTKPAILSSAKDLPEGSGYYIIAGLSVCYNSYPIKKADPETFVYQPDFAKDKNNYYHFANEITEEEFRGAIKKKHITDK